MAAATLYDAYNRPIQRGDLRRKIAAPQLAGVRTLWMLSVASHLTPNRLADRFDELAKFPACRDHVGRATASPPFAKVYVDQMAHFAATD